MTNFPPACTTTLIKSYEARAGQQVSKKVQFVMHNTSEQRHVKAPALRVRSGRLQAGVICRLDPRQMARSAALAATSDATSSSSGRASSQSKM